MTDFEIEFYKNQNGNVPVKDFVLSLDTKMRAKMLRCIEILRKNGNDLREPYTKPLGNGIFELRAKQGSDISRVLYFFVIGRKIVLTNGFIKKTAKTPLKEIDLAEKYRKDYLEKNGKTNYQKSIGKQKKFNKYPQHFYALQKNLQRQVFNM